MIKWIKKLFGIEDTEQTHAAHRARPELTIRSSDIEPQSDLSVLKLVLERELHRTGKTDTEIQAFFATVGDEKLKMLLNQLKEIKRSEDNQRSGSSSSPISDVSLKQHIQPLKHSLEKVLMLQGVTFQWRTGIPGQLAVNGGCQIGLVAQSVEKVVPEVVYTVDTGHRAIEYEKLVSLLIEAIKEQHQKIEELENRITAIVKNNTCSARLSSNIRVKLDA